ncbi:MAG: orotidine-5'-phosphate decarboxylase [Fidelibacterota bacterium]
MNSFTQRLSARIRKSQSWLCVGLDISPEGLGAANPSLQEVKDHCRRVISATHELACAYKPNLAFFERWGADGFVWLSEVLAEIGPGVIKIGDAKRGDIGNTAQQYAMAFFDHFQFDAITVNPYMGEDSIKPFLDFPGKGVFILTRTSNPAAAFFQNHSEEGSPLYISVAKVCQSLNQNDNIGLVVGATAPAELKQIRDLVPGLPLLIPGVGTQGGNLKSSLLIGNSQGDAIINVSRGIAFAGDMSEREINRVARRYVDQMRRLMDEG